MTHSRACSLRLSPNIGGLAKPSCSAPSMSYCNDNVAQWLRVVYNFSAALSEAKQLRYARVLSLRHQTARLIRLALSKVGSAVIQAPLCMSFLARSHFQNYF